MSYRLDDPDLSDFEILLRLTSQTHLTSCIWLERIVAAGGSIPCLTDGGTRYTMPVNSASKLRKAGLIETRKGRIHLSERFRNAIRGAGEAVFSRARCQELHPKWALQEVTS